MSTLELIKNELACFEKSGEVIRSEGDILSKLRVILDGVKLDGDELAEWYAFSVLEDNEDSQSQWKTYFGPPMVRLRDGTIKTAFNLEDITPSMVDYWEKRSTEHSNPILVARYSGLVYTFRKKIQGRKTDRNIAKIYIQNLIDSVISEKISYSTICYIKLQRALNLSSELRLNDLFNSAIAAIREYEKKYSDISRPGTWIKSYDLLINKKFSIPESLTKEILLELNDRFSTCLSINADGKFNIPGAEAAFEKLAEFYKKHGHSENLARIMLRMVDYVEQAAIVSPPIMANHYYEKLLQYVKLYGTKEQVALIFKAIQDLMPKVNDEMKPVGFEMDIQRDKIENIVELALLGDADTVFDKLALGFVFDAEEVTQNMESSGSIMNIITRTLHDDKGRKVATINPDDKVNEGKLILNYSWFLTVSSFLTVYIIDSGINRKILTTENVMDYIKNSYSFDASRYEIIRKGLVSYFERDYITALHLLIPQIEAACLRILEMTGNVILTDAKNNGFNFKILDNVLKDPSFINEVGENNSVYLRTILTSNQGWNLRNKICHGITSNETFSRVHADRVFLVVLYLATHRLTFS